MSLSGTKAPLAHMSPWTKDPRVLVPVLGAALALGLLLLEPARFTSPPYPDAWIYYDYFLDAPGQIASHPAAYHSSRLSVIIPSYPSHRLLPATAAPFALHLALYAIAVLAFWAVVKSE